VPTIHQRARGENGGRAAFCPPYGILPDAQITFWFSEILSSPIISENQKYPASLLPQIKGITTPVITAR
jgi:hypothetical protein